MPKIPNYHVGPLEPHDVAQLEARGAKGRADAAILASADLAVVARDAHTGLIHNFGCAALSSFQHPGLPEPIRVMRGEAFLYHEETALEARGRGLARANLLLRLSILSDKGVQSVLSHTTERTGVVRRYYHAFGFDENGLLLSTSYKECFYWVTLAERKFFDNKPVFSAPGLWIHEASRSDLAEVIRGLTALNNSFEEAGTDIVLFGAGAAAEELIKVVPTLKHRIVGIVDNSERLHGTIFEPTGHRILPPTQWKEFGADHLLYASKAYQSEMQEQHRAFGPQESLGIMLYPVVQVVGL